MRLYLKSKWKEVNEKLPVDQQVRFLQDSFVLYKMHPRHLLLFALIVIMFGWFLVSQGFSLAGRLVVVSMTAYYLWEMFRYFRQWAKFAERWYDNI